MCLFSSLMYIVENRRTFSFQRKVWFLVIQIILDAYIIIEGDLIVCYLYRKKISIKCNFTEDICFCFCFFRRMQMCCFPHFRNRNRNDIDVETLTNWI